MQQQETTIETWIESDFREQHEGITTNCDDMMTQRNDVIDRYNEGKAWYEELWGWILNAWDEVYDALVEFGEAVIAVIEVIIEFLWPGNPYAMMRIAEAWRDVLRLVTGQVAEFDDGPFKGTQSCSGETAEAYRTLPGSQAGALNGVASHITALANAASGHATSVVRAWIGLADVVITYILDQVGNASAFITADPLEWLDCVPKIVAVVRTALGAVKDIVAETGNFWCCVNEEMAELNTAMADITGSHSGKWPTVDGIRW